MAHFHVSFLHRIISGTPSCVRTTQRRWAQVHDVRFRLLATNPNPVLERYQEKLARKVQEHGLRDTQELQKIYQDKITALRKQAAVDISQPLASQSPSSPHAPPTESHHSSPAPLAIKTLSSYLDVEKTRALPVKEIELIWRQRHINNAQSLCAVIPFPLYQTLEATARKHPSFILPLPREGQATEIHYLQWAFPAESVVTVLFTHLAEYKLRGEFSQPHTTVTHHLEMAKDKGIVLLKGEVIAGRGISTDEAKWLLLCLQRFYGGLGEGDEGRKRKALVEMFGKGETSFKVEDLVELAEKNV